MTYVSSERPKKTLPPPFERPKIDISAAGRSWQWVLPEHLKENDIVPDMGLVESVHVWSDPLQVRIVARGGTKDFPVFDFSKDFLNPTPTKIWAFTRTPT